LWRCGWATGWACHGMPWESLIWRIYRDLIKHRKPDKMMDLISWKCNGNEPAQSGAVLCRDRFHPQTLSITENDGWNIGRSIKDAG
jgi:hypothetical protein